MWLRVVNKVRKSTEYGGKRLTLVKESGNTPEFESLILCHKKRIPFWVSVFYLASDRGIRTELNAVRMSTAGEG